MATMQLSYAPRTRKTSKETVFPTQITNEQQSLIMVKKLFATSISCITYLRGLFPESSYGERHVDDLNLKILREDKKCPGSLHIIKWIQGCFDALEKKYLHMAVLTLYTNPKEPEKVTEIYQFKFKYTKYGATMDFDRSCSTFFMSSRIKTTVFTVENSDSYMPGSKQSNNWPNPSDTEEVRKYCTLCFSEIKDSSNTSIDSRGSTEDIKRASILLIRKLYILMQNLEPLPNDVILTMKLHYYNAVTPHDYQPPGFKEAVNSNFLLFDGDPVNMHVGMVSTGFHKIKVKVTTETSRVSDPEDDMTEIVHQGLDYDDDEEEEYNNQKLPASSPPRDGFSNNDKM